MRFRVVVMAGVLVLVGLMWAGGGRAMTFEDMRGEMKAISVPGRTSLDMSSHMPMLFSGTTGRPVSELCVAGGSIRLMDSGDDSVDMGKVRPGNQYSIPVYKQIGSRSGENTFLYQRLVELPTCK